MIGSGNFIVDMYDEEERNAYKYEDGYCTDCEKNPCICDEKQERREA